MLTTNKSGASFWAPFYDASTNLHIDSHVYYFAAAGTYANYVNPAVCGQAQYIAQETKFPVFIGEWSLQAMVRGLKRSTVIRPSRTLLTKFLSTTTLLTSLRARLYSTPSATLGSSTTLAVPSGTPSPTPPLLSTARVFSATTGATSTSSMPVSSPSRPTAPTARRSIASASDQKTHPGRLNKSVGEGEPEDWLLF